MSPTTKLDTSVASRRLFRRVPGLHHNGRIRRRRHQGEHIRLVCVRCRQTSPAFGLMIWDPIGFTTRPPLTTCCPPCPDLPRHRGFSSVYPALGGSPNFSVIEIIRSWVAETLGCYLSLATTIDEVWYRIEAASSDLPISVIKAQIYSMPNQLSVILAARKGS
ncbi:hypothetical protein TNCV_4747611 [Trichonephila clavipes]|nr:hypothetical protein TNCV_4747611 [Trichonephila clavipes]